MPDTERLRRSLQLHLATKQMKPVLQAQFDDEDKVRWQIVKVFAGASIFLIILSWIGGGI